MYKRQIFNKKIPVDKFLEKVLYEPKVGYYNNRIPFGKNGDFVTSPTISNLFSEILAVWIISTWEKFEKPEIFNLVELGPGDGSLTKVLIQTFKKFPKFNKSVKIFLYLFICLYTWSFFVGFRTGMDSQESEDLGTSLMAHVFTGVPL